MSINLTLICPVYASLESINSILKQINLLDEKYCPYIEIIIINDCSPHIFDQDIKRKISKFPKNIINQYIYLSENIGAGEVRNLGISLANSKKYIGFIDDDDIPDIGNILNITFDSDVDIIISPLTKNKTNFKSTKVYKSNLIFLFFPKGLFENSCME